jgi:hypothetical protein
MESRYHELSKASSVADIVRLTAEYLSSWSVEELERLPDDCRPSSVRGIQDIETWADRLAQTSARAAMLVDDERRLDRLTSHFLIASVRLRQLAPAHG